jgi:hypothetical protein
MAYSFIFNNENVYLSSYDLMNLVPQISAHRDIQQLNFGLVQWIQSPMPEVYFKVPVAMVGRLS